MVLLRRRTPRMFSPCRDDLTTHFKKALWGLEVRKKANVAAMCDPLHETIDKTPIHDFINIHVEQQPQNILPKAVIWALWSSFLSDL